MTRVALFVAVLQLAAGSTSRPTDGLVTYRVLPSETDAAIARFNTANYVVFDPQAPASANLLLFMTGTGGNPAGVSDFLDVAAAQGYRAIALAYNDTPAVVALCTSDPDPACSGRVRQKRIFGEDVTRKIDDTPTESILNRLSKLLAALDRSHPSDGWGQYLEHGAPNWARIAVAGHSQGAGMAAFIAQRQAVARVILFSSPWDFYGRDRQMAPWVAAGPGATPAERWFGAYHKKENTAALIARAYRALKIADANIRVMTREPSRVVGENPYHVSMVGNGATPRQANGSPAYTDDWRFLVGSGIGPGR
jgi:predicted esterase